jgi:hypothetical protein
MDTIEEQQLQDKCDALVDMMAAQRDYKRALAHRNLVFSHFLIAFPDIEHTSIEGMIEEANSNGQE